MQFINNYPCDENYKTPVVGGGPSYENAKLIVTGKRRLVNLYAFNSSGAQVYLAVEDAVATDITATQYILPIAALSYVNLASIGGDRFENGIFLAAYTNVTLQTLAGSVLSYKLGWTGYS